MRPAYDQVEQDGAPRGRLFLNAMNIHVGGGKTLLREVLSALDGRDYLAQLDTRFSDESGLPEARVRAVPPSLRSRIGAQWWLSRQATAQDTVLCFGNLPPLFPIAGRVIVFVQNKFVIERVSWEGFPLRTRLRLLLEWYWMKAFARHADLFVVQTESMRRALEKSGLAAGAEIAVLPFAEVGHAAAPTAAPQAPADREHDFIYVASGEPHKNHQVLLQAWCELARRQIFPSLCLTLDEQRFPALCAELAELRDTWNLRVHNEGHASPERIAELYGASRALIYPSRFESFGLPLLEAAAAGLPIIAAELDYVRDLIDPVQTFDPQSPVSLARAVQRFLGKSEQRRPILDGGAFLEHLSPARPSR